WSRSAGCVWRHWARVLGHGCPRSAGGQIRVRPLGCSMPGAWVRLALNCERKPPGSSGRLARCEPILSVCVRPGERRPAPGARDRLRRRLQSERVGPDRLAAFLWGRSALQQKTSGRRPLVFYVLYGSIAYSCAFFKRIAVKHVAEVLL